MDKSSAKIGSIGIKVRQVPRDLMQRRSTFLEENSWARQAKERAEWAVNGLSATLSAKGTSDGREKTCPNSLQMTERWTN